LSQFIEEGQGMKKSIGRRTVLGAAGGIALGAPAVRAQAGGGVALVIDYGHEKTAPGDTLQAVRGHRYVPILIDAGEQDLTAHVDFEALGQDARNAGAKVTEVVTQGEWLNRLGIGARAAALATANPERVPELEKAVDRLCHEEQMGQLFKVMAIHSPDWPAPAGFAQ